MFTGRDESGLSEFPGIAEPSDRDPDRRPGQEWSLSHRLGLIPSYCGS